MKIIKFNLEELKQKNDGFSLYILGRSYDLEKNDAKQNYKEAISWYEKGLKENYPLCEYSLGISYLMGLDNTIDINIENGDLLLKSAYPKIIELINSKKLIVEKNFADKIATEQILIKNGGHINSESGYTKFFEILQYTK